MEIFRKEIAISRYLGHFCFRAKRDSTLFFRKKMLAKSINFLELIISPRLPVHWDKFRSHELRGPGDKQTKHALLFLPFFAFKENMCDVEKEISSGTRLLPSVELEPDQEVEAVLSKGD